MRGEAPEFVSLGFSCVFPVFCAVWESLIQPGFLIVEELRRAEFGFKKYSNFRSRGFRRGGADIGPKFYGPGSLVFL